MLDKIVSVLWIAAVIGFVLYFIYHMIIEAMDNPWIAIEAIKPAAITLAIVLCGVVIAVEYRLWKRRR